MRSNFIVRIRVILGFVLLVAAFLLTKLYFVQIVYGDEYSARADRQYVRPNENLFDRGSIFFEDKDGRLVSAATLKTGFTVSINPNVLQNPENVYEKISGIIELDRDEFFKRAGKTDDPYEEIAKRVSPENGLLIDGLHIEGVKVHKERWRFYPGEALAAQTIGFVAFQEDELSGRYGLERYYNDTLSRNTNNLYVNFFAEIFSNINTALFTGDDGREGDIVTTIEPSVQLFLERKLEEIGEKWNPRQAAGIIINPQNGEIYAMGIYPSFDINRFSEVEDASVFSHSLVEGAYEMGSIIKPLTLAAGLDSGAITADTTYYDQGFVTLDGLTISNFDGKGRGRVPMQEILNQSLNTGATFVMQKMGTETFREYMLKYGIGKETGIDLPNEGVGLVKNLESPRTIEYATASFGQGIAITPIETVRALSTLANGGVLVTPHLGKEIKYRTGLSKTISYVDGQRVLQESTSEEITRMLVKVVDEALLGGTVKFPNYSVAAKTGTAQIANTEERGYYDDRFLHSFFGYFPAYDPRFLVFFIMLEPKEVRFASQTLTLPFIDSVHFLINYYDVPPDR
ncbi:penicillin-binding protein 2 [Candidatus Kaiserbacteria bacterium]|nr:penicillin-binding protein 2 [Candidatus Kaiserbacteria bacterium]